MALTPCRELSAAAWIVDADQPWQRLVSFGPSGFPAYARLRFVPDPAYQGQSENDIEISADARSETEQLRSLLNMLARRTTTPDQCFFCLWDGWGGLDGGQGARSVKALMRTVRRGPQIQPAFPRSVLDGAKFVVPHRAYYLFEGPLTSFGDWGAADMWPGQPRTHMPDPAFIWPLDHAWCVAKDVDPHWAGIGADQAVIDELIDDSRLDVVRADPHEDQPHYQ